MGYQPGILRRDVIQTNVVRQGLTEDWLRNRQRGAARWYQQRDFDNRFPGGGEEVREQRQVLTGQDMRMSSPPPIAPTQSGDRMFALNTNTLFDPHEAALGQTWGPLHEQMTGGVPLPGVRRPEGIRAQRPAQ